jgi:Family of unknown function (DUF6279)
MNIRKSFFSLTLILLCCSGCSKLTIGYNYADWLLRFWINGFTSFNAEQKEQIHLEVDNYMHWHRKNALPEYITYLQQVNAAINRKGGLQVDDVMHVLAENNRLYQLTLEPMIRPAAHILSTLDSQQITELADTFAERNGKQRKKMLQGSEHEMLVARAERHVELVKNLVGNLSAEQEEKITQMSLHIPFASRAFIEQREAKQARLIALLRDKAGEDQIAAYLQQWLTAPEATRTPQQQQAIAAYENDMNEMTVGIAKLLTERQKHYLTEEINSYIDDFKKINSADEPANTKSRFEYAPS